VDVADAGNVAPGGIFAQPWWLDAVAPGAWDAVVIETDGEIQARLPYIKKRRRGFTYLTMPPLTQHLGPWIHSYGGKNPQKLATEKHLMTALIDRLPLYDVFTQHFHYSISNWLPFYWRGFQQTTRYTYVLDRLDDLDAVWNGMRENIRRGVRKAKKLVIIRDDLGLDAFQDLNEKTFRRQGLPVPYGRDLVARIDQACAERGCRRILVAEDAQKRLHAGIFLVWDSRAAYYLIGGADPELRNSGAMSLAMWEAIQGASTVTQTFDFEGSMLEPIEHFFRAFGADQKPYFRVTKTNSPLLKIKGDLRSSLSMLKSRLRKSAR
jgi:hypothetical protein